MPRNSKKSRPAPAGTGRPSRSKLAPGGKKQQGERRAAPAAAPAPVAGLAPEAPVVRPEILAPAGDMRAALAAFAAGADAVYVGLKHFSARMEAENFSTADLAALADLAHAEKRRVYVAMNTLVKPGESGQAYRLIRRLSGRARPDALIVQDPGILDLARQAGFAGELHLSTLANITHPAALKTARLLGADRVIIPRELSLDEVRLMSEACPEGMSLELFVHGALCYCVSGRCWWSSYMGGKSGLRGRCVQPCRRVYTQKGREGRFFSSLDLSLDVLVRALLRFEHLRSWKIEGRKKSPHYVHYVTAAYRLLRDEPDSPEAGREAARMLERALGRPGTRSRMAEGGEQAPTGGKDAQTSSGLLCGRIVKNEDGRYAIRPRFDLFPKDRLRVGYEDEAWHCTLALAGKTAKDAPLALALPRGKHPKAGTPVFLIDRKEPELAALLADWTARLERRSARAGQSENVAGLEPALPEPWRSPGALRPLDIRLVSALPQGRQAKTGLRPGTVQGLWLSPKTLRDISKTLFGRISWWLPPVIWPDEESLWQRLLLTALWGGARHIVCNAPWQLGLFPDRKGLSLTAGPFCNIANGPAIGALARLGFNAAIVSPELGGEDLLALPGQSPLPLGIVLSGFWPVGISRHSAAPLNAREGFQSPKGERFWMRRYGKNTWIYPAWPLDITGRRPALERAGYATFIHMDEHPPKAVPPATRPGEFNWTVDVL